MEDEDKVEVKEVLDEIEIHGDMQSLPESARRGALAMVAQKFGLEHEAHWLLMRTFGDIDIELEDGE